MKIIIVSLIACLLALSIASTRAQPVATLEDEHLAPHFRIKRVSCDILSVEAKGIKINDAACAAHCLVLGRTGGYCNGKRVCICR